MEEENALCKIHSDQLEKVSEEISCVKADLSDVKGDIQALSELVRADNQQMFTLLSKTIDYGQENRKTDMNAYIKVLFIVLAVLGTISLSVFGIKELIIPYLGG